MWRAAQGVWTLKVLLEQAAGAGAPLSELQAEEGKGDKKQRKELKKLIKEEKKACTPPPPPHPSKSAVVL